MALLRRVRTVGLAVSEDAREMQRLAEEEVRIVGIERRRRYYDGTQYDERNEARAKALNCPVEELPEQQRLVAYSTQIGECIDFLSDRLGEGFTVTAKSSQVQDVIDSMVEATDQIAAENESGEIEIVTDDLLREAFQAGDVPVYVGWDAFEQRVFLEFWEAESIEFVVKTTRVVEKVIRTQVIWAYDDAGQFREITERVEYTISPNALGFPEAVARTYWDEDEGPRREEWLGLGEIPWRLLRADQKRLRQHRGEALITDQVLALADRYNNVEQVSYLIARYNSHGNLAVVGDGAQLKAESDGRLKKDVADVLTFPGGTTLAQITLPTDPRMIEHQRGVLSDAMYAVFGLTRVEPDTFQGLGGVTGYALEILNQKSETTYKRVARRWRKDFLSLLSLVLDVHAWKSMGKVGIGDTLTGQFTEVDPENEAAYAETLDPESGKVAIQAWWEVDPQDVFPDRTIEIQMGTGYVVDEVMIRDDFVAELISREEALRKRGYNDTEIKKIVKEIEDAKPEPAEDSSYAGADGEQQATVTLVPGTGTGTQAGSTVADATREQ